MGIQGLGLEKIRNVRTGKGGEVYRKSGLNPPPYHGWGRVEVPHSTTSYLFDFTVQSMLGKSRRKISILLSTHDTFLWQILYQEEV